MPQFLKKYGKTLLITVCIIAGLTAAFFLTGKSKESVVQDASSSSVSVIVSQDADIKQRELSESENSALKKEQPLRSDDRTKRGSDADESVFAVSEPKEKSSASQGFFVKYLKKPLTDRNRLLCRFLLIRTAEIQRTASIYPCPKHLKAVLFLQYPSRIFLNHRQAPKRL